MSDHFDFASEKSGENEQQGFSKHDESVAVLFRLGESGPGRRIKNKFSEGLHLIPSLEGVVGSDIFARPKPFLGPIFRRSRPERVIGRKSEMEQAGEAQIETAG